MFVVKEEEATMRIISDTCTLLSVAEGAEFGLTILPLTVSIYGETWLEYEQISSEEFLAKVRAGATPTSSSPPPALILDAWDTDEEILHISVAEGLSGTYEVAVGLRSQAKHPERVHVLNSQTLCTPQRIIALCAVHFAQQDLGIEELIHRLEPMIASTHSYLIPKDYDFLRRGGRLTPLAAKIMGLMKAIPVVRQTEDGKQLERFTVTRKFKAAIDAICNDLEKQGIGENYYIGISHAGNEEDAELARVRISEHFPQCRTGVFELSPVFITQGGPDCVSIQVIDISSCPYNSFG